jgi:putative NADH-flavin reductase
MKVALIGASGNGGRGHEVTAIARNPDTIAKLPGVTEKRAMSSTSGVGSRCSRATTP